MRKIACVLALGCAGAGCASLGAAEIGGRYATQPSADAAAATASAASETRIMEIATRRNAFSLTYQTPASRHKRHGWGLLDGEQLAVALSTGGSAYGVAIYHHVPGEHAWSGPWISSLDGGAALGTIQFADGTGLEGRHALVCARPGAGSVSGTVEIKAAAAAYQLTFNLGRAVYYRGVGVLLAGDRLAVGWSFGSAPELAVYDAGASGSLTEHHVSWTPHPASVEGGPFVPISEEQYFAALNPPGGASRLPLFGGSSEPDLPANAAYAGPDAALPVGPVGPQVKAWSYDALIRQYGNDGWAERWLEGQLTLEELRLLHAALRRQEVHGDTVQEGASRSIGTVIEKERVQETRR